MRWLQGHCADVGRHHGTAQGAEAHAGAAPEVGDETNEFHLDLIIVLVTSSQ